jgi:hypothetical protein
MCVEVYTSTEHIFVLCKQPEAATTLSQATPHNLPTNKFVGGGVLKADNGLTQRNCYI